MHVGVAATFRRGYSHAQGCIGQFVRSAKAANLTMKLTAVSILKWNGEKDAFLLGIAADLSSFGFFQRSTVKEMLTFLSRTVAKRTQPGQRQSVQQEEYYAHIYNRDGLVGIAIVDKDYPARAAFGVVNKMLDDFSESSQERWRSIQADNTDAQLVLDSAIVKFQVCAATGDWKGRAAFQVKPLKTTVISAVRTMFLVLL